MNSALSFVIKATLVLAAACIAVFAPEQKPRDQATQQKNASQPTAGANAVTTGDAAKRK